MRLDELWDLVQERLKVNSGNAARNQERPVLLRGLLYCGECGWRMIRNRFTRGKYHYDKNRCGSHWRPFSTSCTGEGVSLRECNDWVWSKVKSVFLYPSIIEQELKRLEETGCDPEMEVRLENARRELERLESCIQGLLHCFRRDTDDLHYNIVSMIGALRCNAKTTKKRMYK